MSALCTKCGRRCARGPVCGHCRPQCGRKDGPRTEGLKAPLGELEDGSIFRTTLTRRRGVVLHRQSSPAGPSILVQMDGLPGQAADVVVRLRPDTLVQADVAAQEEW